MNENDVIGREAIECMDEIIENICLKCKQIIRLLGEERKKVIFIVNLEFSI